MRPLVEADLVALYDHIAPIAVGIVNDGRECAPQIAFAQMHEKKPGVITNLIFLEPRMVMTLQHPNGRELLMTLIKDMLGAEPVGTPMRGLLRLLLQDKGIRIDAVVQVNETWQVSEVPPDHPDHGKAPSQCKDRREAVTLTLHVRAHSYVRSLFIETVKGRRSVKLEPLDLHGKDTPEMVGGRMCIQQDVEVQEAIRKAGFKP